MFHNNYKIYQTGLGEYRVEVQFWNSISEKVETLNLDKLTEECMLKIVELLTKLELDFDYGTPDKGE